MASEDKKESDSDDAVSKHVLEYYQKYSQNRDLCKFFTGTPVAYIPEIVDEFEKEDLEDDAVDVLDHSRASSAFSNHRKLEWDNGADIGYDNCQILRKCSSLPVLLNKKKTVTCKQRQAPIVLVPYDDSVIDQTTKNAATLSSSSSEENIQENLDNMSSSSSNHGEVNKPVVSSSSSERHKPTTTYFHRMIGSPDAQSTPKLQTEDSDSKSDKHHKLSTKSSSLDNVCVTTKEEFRKFSVENIPAEYVGEFLKNSIVNLHITKPVTIECVDRTEKNTKNVQTSINIDSKATQTEKIVKNNKKPRKDNQVVCFIEYSSEKPSSQSESDKNASNCDSFEFIKGDKPTQQQQNIVEQPEIRSYYPNLPQSKKPNTQTESESQQSSSFDEIEQHLNVLQRLIKSKKYDSATKKHYMKKILKKIAQSEENSQTSTSSNLFMPKQSTEKFPEAQKVTPTTSDSSDAKMRAENLKWYPIKKLTSQTFAQKVAVETENHSSKEHSEIQAEIIPINTRNRKKLTRFTLTNNEFLVNPYESNRSDDFNTLPKGDCSPFQGSSSGSYNNWKDDKTTSERLLEERLSREKEDFPAGGDYVLDCAKRERGQQLKWINNEISHLNKLKFLLEKPNSTETSASNPSTTERNPRRKTTTTYKVAANNGSKPRKYVIERELVDGQLPQTHDFLLSNKKYTVTELDSHPVTNARKNVQNDIQVTSNESTIEVKIRTLCKTCQKSPCECISDAYKNITCFICMRGDCSCPKFCKSCMKYQCVCGRQNARCMKLPCVCGKCVSPCPKCSKTLCMCRCFWCQQNPCVCSHRRRECCVCRQAPCVCEPSKSHTYPKSKQCCCGNKGTVTCCEMAVQTSLKSEKVLNKSVECCASTSDSLESFESVSSGPSTGSKIMCACCKKKEAAENVSLLVSEHRYPLCHTCLDKNPGVATICYDSEEHICTCYTELNTENLNKYNNKVKGAERGCEKAEKSFCTCVKPSLVKNSNCAYCQCKLQKTARSKNGIAYTLTLEPGSPAPAIVEAVKPLEEIRVKVPCNDVKKRRKDVENLGRKRDAGVEISITNAASENMERKSRVTTLQECLFYNRPDFVCSAESRRHVLLNNMDQRIENKDNVKLRFFEDNVHKRERKGDSNRLFTHKEMKEINRKNYKKCPEVQAKLSERREQQLRDANKLIVSLFTKKLQGCVLKGKKNFPIDANVINLACTNK